eukprot:g17089.t1
MLSILAKSLLISNKNVAFDFLFDANNGNNKQRRGQTKSRTAATAAEAGMAMVGKTDAGGEGKRDENRGQESDKMKETVRQGLQSVVESVERHNQVGTSRKGGGATAKAGKNDGKKQKEGGRQDKPKKNQGQKKKKTVQEMMMMEAEDDGSAAKILKDLDNVKELKSKTKHSQKPFVWWMSSQASSQSQGVDGGGEVDDEKEFREAVDVYWQQAVPDAVEVDGYGGNSAVLEWTMEDRHAESAETRSRAVPTEREYKLRLPGVLPKEAIFDVKIPLAHKVRLLSDQILAGAVIMEPGEKKEEDAAWRYRVGEVVEGCGKEGCDLCGCPEQNGAGIRG